MCSTPRPKRNIKTAKTRGNANGAILSHLSAQKRAEFVQRANEADERRHQQQMQQCQTNQQQQKHLKQTLQANNIVKSADKKGWQYWLVDANIKEILMALFFVKVH